MPIVAVPLATGGPRVLPTAMEPAPAVLQPTPGATADAGKGTSPREDTASPTAAAEVKSEPGPADVPQQPASALSMQRFMLALACFLAGIRVAADYHE
jgi:hypothetical protein